MNEAAKNKSLSYITNNAEDEKTREKLKNIPLSVFENRNKKCEDFQKAVKKFKNDQKCQFIHPLIQRHFLFKDIQELNEKVIKEKEGYLIDFTDRIYEYLNNQTMLYWKMGGYYTEVGVLDENLVNKDFYCLDQVIKQNTNYEKFIQWIEKIETNLPVSYIELPC